MRLRSVKAMHGNIPDNQRGVTMLEVLIALAILSIGLAGVAIMHLNSLKYTKAAYERSIASTIALDLEERLWLKLANTDDIGCPDLELGDGAIAELITQWTGTPDDGVLHPTRIPNLTVTIGTPTLIESTDEDGNTLAEGSGPLNKEIDITLTWGSEDVQRFTTEANTDMYFNYKTRILCSAEYPGS